MPMRRSGFTLIELIIVMVLMAIVAAVALPKIRVTGFRADAGSMLVGSTMQLAQRLAIQKQHNVVVSFDQANNRILLHEDLDNDQSVDPNEKATWRALEEGARFATPPSGISSLTGGAIRGSNVQTINTYPSVIFRRDGATSSDLEAYVTSASTRPEDFRAVALTQSTGRVNYWRRSTGSWRRSGE